MIVDSFVSTILVWAPVTATILVWLNFNLLHRQYNQLRNILFSTVIAAMTLAGCIALLLSANIS
jgi:hypothetical protein